MTQSLVSISLTHLWPAPINSARNSIGLEAARFEGKLPALEMPIDARLLESAANKAPESKQNLRPAIAQVPLPEILASEPGTPRHSELAGSQRSRMR